MEHSTENTDRRDRISQTRRRWSIRHRVLAMVLTLTMILSSSGLLAQAETQTEETTTSTEETASTGENTSSGVSNEVTILSDDSFAVNDSDDSFAVDDSDDSFAVDDSDDSFAVDDSDEGFAVDDSDEGFAVNDSDEGFAVNDSDEGFAVSDGADSGISTQANPYTDSDGNYDITNLMTQDSYIKIEVDGTFYTIDELNAKGLQVPKGATIFAHLVWDAVPGIEKGQKLVYQIPAKMVTNIVEEERFMFSDSHKTFAGYMSLSSDGLFTVEIDSSYFTKWSKNQGTDTLELDFLNLEFYGSLSSEHGETSGGDDALITFKGATEAEPKSAVEFTIPFEYKNEHSPVDVEKSSTFNGVDQTIDYTVKVSTPSTNTMTSEGVKLTDSFESTTYLVSDSSNPYGIYSDVKAILYTNTKDGTVLSGGTDISSKFALNRSGNGYLNIGDLEPDSVVILTYTVNVSDKYFAGTSNPELHNTALATYNDITKNVGRNSSDDVEQCSGMVKIAKGVGDMKADSNGDAYLLYTVTVTAYGGTVSDISVTDDFITNVKAIKDLKDITVTSGTYTQGENNSLVWYVGKLTDRQIATLTYKAYLDPDAWSLSTTTTSGTAVQRKLNIYNQAKLYVGDTLYSTVTPYKEITKTWVNKAGMKNDSTGNVTYTLKINADPTASDITEIHDSLDSFTVAGGATISYPISMTVYKSSSNPVKVGTYSLSQSDVKGTSSGWSLDLTTYEGGALKGSYYYVLSYTVTNTSGVSNVGNEAGINRANGTTYGEGTSIAVKTITSSKALTMMDYVNGYCTWTSTMRTDIDAGAVYYDWLDSDNVTSYGIWWFTIDLINAVEVYQGDTLIYSQAQGINPYNISVEPYNPYSTTNVGPFNVPYYEWNSTFTSYTNNKTKIGKVGYYGFKVNFGDDIKVEGISPIYIKYNISVSKENIYTRGRVSHKDVFPYGYVNPNYPLKYKNMYKWVLNSGVTKTEQNGNNGTMVWYYDTEDVLKGSTYDPTTGIITWKIYLNHQADMIGDATVIDTLPEGLEYVSATLSYDISDGRDYISSSFTTSNANSSTKYGNIKKNDDGTDMITLDPQEDGTTKITVELENLKGYTFNTYTEQEDGTLKATACNSSAALKSNWYDDGNVVLTITTRISDELMMKGVESGAFTNTVTVNNATMAYGTRTTSATQKVSIAAEDENLQKSMVNYTSGTILQFNMTINPEGEDLIYNSDELKIRDVMASNMSLATWKNNYFIVKSGDTVLSEDEYTVTQVDCEDGTAYEITVPDGKALTITYLVSIDAAVGQTVTVSNKAYFDYDGLREANDNAVVEKPITIQWAQGDTGTSGAPTFQVYKTDQWGNPVEGVTFALVKVKMENDADLSGTAVKDASGQVELDESSKITATTDVNGYLTFSGLDEHAIYCLYEVSAPEGYVVAPERTYLYFFYRKTDPGVPNLLGISYYDKIFTFQNRFSSASLNVPLEKTINGATQETENEFSFTLTNTSAAGYNLYSDEACQTAINSAQVTIQGSGTTSFDTLYLNRSGDYTFMLNENDLSEDATKEGFAKSDVEYTIQVTVANGSNGLYLSKATYSWVEDGETKTGDLLNGDVPLFNNTLTLDPVVVQLNGYKELTGGRSYNIKEGEFTFEVVEDGEVVATGTTKAGSQSWAEIVFDEIVYDQNQLGPHVLTIYEVSGSDFTIEYADTQFFATVTVAPVPGEAKLAATVTYNTQDKTLLNAKDGYPIFINAFSMITPTGLHTAYLPFVTMFALAATIGGVFYVRKRRRKQTS